MTLAIDIGVARRFILGKQGLWPGRRWRGSAGTEQAMREMEYVQLDPLQIIARSHDIALHSRVIDYTPELWQDIAYQQRRFFDWGGWLATRPMDELPYWRVVMRRERNGDPDCDPRVHKMLHEHADVMAEIRALLNERGTLSNRDFDAAERKRTQSYRGRKDSSLGLYYLWRAGDVMTHHRENFERVYALTEAVAPEDLIWERGDEETDRFLLKKEISFSGLAQLSRTSDAFQRGVPFSRKQSILDALLANGDIIEVKVEGWRAVHYALSSDVELINDLMAGRVPNDWKPLNTTTTDEVVFLAPLDQVSARGRAKTLFDFDYVWEVYKPEHKRTYGYYTMPILWGDRLVARFDSRLDRPSNTFVILGFWLEDAQLGKNEAFAEALARGFTRFVGFLGASKLDARAISEALLQKRLQSSAE
ncbi:MAG: YcaQ family DNA glycosylase [Anaerolineae bacterium]|nr:YcaQ family DNA glycosylase [Anaerolineae bacterium]